MTETLSARALNANHIRVLLPSAGLVKRLRDVKVEGLKLHSARIGPNAVDIKTSRISIQKNYRIQVGEHETYLNLGYLLDKLYSGKPLGCCFEQNQLAFRLFAPRATDVKLVLFREVNGQPVQTLDMKRDKDGVWEVFIQPPDARFYGYTVAGPEAPFEIFKPGQVLADPYSPAVASLNTHLHPSKSHIPRADNRYDWQGDSPVNIAPEDLIIYEMHVRDMTMHHSSGVVAGGTYDGLFEKGVVGGINHIKQLGVNAVELLPCQHFAKIEPPFNRPSRNILNTWNPHERNHWGYMTSYFFAPEPYYSDGVKLKANHYCGASGEQVSAFKNMVKNFHRAGIAVIMDVVYNHVSNYDWNPLKYIDKQYYFRLDDRFDFQKASGCGNDFKSERRMARRLIVDSVKHWMTEYHIDGFRFDLAALLDWDTIEAIGDMARTINPYVTLIAEPWGGDRYDLRGFSERGWLVWNDLFRNGIKGQDPVHAHGFIFGEYYANDNNNSLRFYQSGSRQEDGGPLVKSEHSVNYLESHDGYTLGDFIRIGTGAVRPEELVSDLDANAELDEHQMRINKLAALFLFVSRGAVMLHAGQEFARSKVAAQKGLGLIDHNSYEKDNETNWLDYGHRELNRELFDYYHGLINLRKKYAAFKTVSRDQLHFLDSEVQPTLAFMIPKEASGDPYDFLALLNGNVRDEALFTLPPGSWRAVADPKQAGTETFGESRRYELRVPPRSGYILARKWGDIIPRR